MSIIRQGEAAKYNNAVLPLIDYLQSITGAPVSLLGVGRTPENPLGFGELSLISLSSDSKLSRWADYLFWMYFSEGNNNLSEAFSEIETIRGRLEQAPFHVDGLQYLEITNGAILTDSSYPGFYCFEFSLNTLHVGERVKL